MNLKVLTFNCFGPPFITKRTDRFPLIALEVEKLNPDLVMFQEVIFRKDGKVLEEHFLNRGWDFFYQKNGLMFAGGLAMAARKKLLTNIKFAKFKKQGGFLNYLLGDVILGKGYQIAELNISGKKINVANAHFMYLYKGATYMKAQKSQMQQLVSSLKNLNSKDLILAGDLNIDNPESDQINWIKSELKVSDNLPAGTYTIDPNNLNRRDRIISIISDGKTYRPDYILVSENIKVKNEKVVFDEIKISKNHKIQLSDHFGLLAEIEI